MAGISARHVEIMRGELASILYEATFEHGPPRRLGLVVGADGLHSNVRRLVFGQEAGFRHYLGGYLGVFTLPNYRGLKGGMVAWNAPGKSAAMYPVRQTGQARALLLFRAAEELRYDHGDLEAKKRLLRETFAERIWELPRILSELDAAPDFYFDSISQIRMPTWSRGRVTLVGDAGYSPGPAVDGGRRWRS